MAHIAWFKWTFMIISAVRSDLPKFHRSVLTVMLTMLMAATGGAAEKPKYFSIKMNDKLIGYAAIDRETIPRDGREVLRLKSETSLKFALLGKERNTLLDSVTLIKPKTGRVLSYRMTETTNEVVRHVESEFTDGTARTWIHREGDPRGKSVETKLVDGTVILGGNNFAHWQLLLKAATDRVAGGAAKIPVFLPDARQTDIFEFVRGKPKDIVLAGETRKCVVWRLEKSNLNALTDAQTNEFVRLELPAQQTMIELADANVVKLVQKARAEEVLAQHFTQSNVVFDEFLKVNFVKADIDVKVIGSGIANGTSVLTTAMQEFDGKKEKAHIVGEVSIRSVSYRGKDSPTFPTPAGKSVLDDWLKPSVYIESDHSSIVAKSGELTKGAEMRWDAVQRLGRWVHQEITYTIGDTPSARLALEKKTGDCGPHSTLMVAMLRAAGIPARLVGGLVYTPTFGGSFGQHAWVEVYMGKSGWIAIDPTTGEFERLSATHIKLFEGLGGVIPKSVTVAAFEPPNREATAPALSEAKPLSWKLGKKYTFKFTKGDKELGTESFKITKVKQDGKEAYQLESDLKLKLSPTTSVNSNAALVIAPNAQPILFTRDLSVLQQKVKIKCSFKDGVVKEEISGSKNLSREIKLPAGAYCFDNNMMGCWVLICSQLRFEANKPVNIKTFHPSSMQIIPLTFTPKAPAPIKIGGKKLVCFECEVSPIKNTFWISRDGHFVRAKQGDLVIEVTEVD